MESDIVSSDESASSLPSSQLGAGYDDSSTAYNGSTELQPTRAEETPGKLDEYSLDKLIEIKISRFLGQLGDYPPDDLHAVMMGSFEKPLLTQVLRRSGGNQVHAAKMLGINRNTLRKRLKNYGIQP